MSVLLPILLSSAAACGLTVILAAALLVVEKLLVNRGTCVVDVNDGERKLEVTGGRSVLTTLTDEGIFIPSACGGRGTCSYCMLKMTAGAGPLSPTEMPLLTAEEIERGLRISCQVKVRNDLAVTIPAELLSVREYRGVVERIRDLTGDIKELRIRLVEPEAIDFTAGQYIQLRAPAYGDNPDPVYRAYSISSPPSARDGIELIVRLVPGGICTTWIFTMLTEGDEVVFNGPYGEFRLSEAGGPMIWIAGGSGMAPFWSMVRHMKQTGHARPCTYFFGAVRERDLFFTDELKALARELPWFSYVPALSGPAESNGWTGETGLITEVVDRHVREAGDLEAYLCGSPGMIAAAAAVLHAKGIGEQRMYYDKFE